MSEVVIFLKSKNNDQRSVKTWLDLPRKYCYDNIGQGASQEGTEWKAAVVVAELVMKKVYTFH